MSTFREGCTSDAECAAVPFYINSQLVVHGANVEAVCVAHRFYDYAQPSDYDDFDDAFPAGLCFGKPPATGVCWD